MLHCTFSAVVPLRRAATSKPVRVTPVVVGMVHVTFTCPAATPVAATV